MKIYLADECPLLLDRIREMLGELPDMEVIGVASEASKVIPGINSLRPDVVVLDIQQPKGAALNILRAIKRTNEKTVVIMMTNYNYPQYRERSIKAGADFFFHKSTELSKMIQTLRDLGDAKL